MVYVVISNFNMFNSNHEGSDNPGEKGDLEV